MNTPRTKYLLITEAAFDKILVQRLFDNDAMPVPTPNKGLYSHDLTSEVSAFSTSYEPAEPYSALINSNEFMRLTLDTREHSPLDLYGRIARVVKALASPPIHLPRSWSEFHYKNLVSFFALQKSSADFRWIVDIDGANRCARFECLTSGDAQLNLTSHTPHEWPNVWDSFHSWISDLRATTSPEEALAGLVEEVDLKAIGSASVVQNRTFEQWLSLLSGDQKKILEPCPDQSVRIIGPAGSGKTLTLCMRALQTARDKMTVAQGKKILIITHTWAMAERIDGILVSLSGGDVPKSITVLPLLYVLQLYGAQIGQQTTKVIGDDSKAGYVATIEIIQEILPAPGTIQITGLSGWISTSLESQANSRSRTELALNLYEEFTGVLAASGVSFDDTESLQKYLGGSREDWMPPFQLAGDRKFVLETYKNFLHLLVDRGAITTDQLVLDSIRVLETFAWRIRRESEGFDYVYVDELQLFNPQERLAIELLGRSGRGVPFSTAEDPSQGVFSALNAHSVVAGVDKSVYLESVHRFEPKIFEFIKFVYQKFPLNTIPLKISHNTGDTSHAPTIYHMPDDNGAIEWAATRAQNLVLEATGGLDRICLVTLGDIEDSLREKLEKVKLPVVQLRSFDDVEQLSYRKKSIVIAPWQFIGGTQFSHVVVIVAGIQTPTTAFGRLRELTSIYLACSRSVASLDIVCGVYIPQVVQEAVEAGLMLKKE